MAYVAWSVVYGEQPSAAKWNILGSNDASFNDGTGIANNAIAAAKLSTSAILLGYTQITTGFNTNSTSAVQVTGLTSSVTIPSGGRKTKITAYSYGLYCSSGDQTIASIWDGTVGSGTQLQAFQCGGGTNGEPSGMAMIWVGTPSAGSKTYNIGMKVNGGGGGTSYYQADATYPGYILVEAV